MFKRHNEKILIGFIFGVLISSIVVVYATTYVGAGTDVSYNNSSSGLSSTNVQDALDELYRKRTRCPSGYSCLVKKPALAVGDYISYTPTKTSYTTDKTKTGYTSTQTINPSELNLWRVLRINNDGTIDLISEYVSSTSVFFKSQTGYQNLVGYLNVLASQYENSTYTSGSRYFGYNGQTEYITDTSKFTKPAPWTCGTGGSCSPAPVESQGGGDTLYTTDYNLVNTALGTRVANKVGTTTATSYWMASRYYRYTPSVSYAWQVRYVSEIGNLGSVGVYTYSYSSSSFVEVTGGFALRPIVTLKAGLTYSGVGTKEYPMQITTTPVHVGDYVSYTPSKTSYTTDKTKTGHNSTQTINPSELNTWRVLSVNDDGTVDIISEYLSSTSVYFRGKTGYQNFVGYLNVLASQYENSTYTSGSRYFGYNGQTEYITDTSKFTSPAPWKCDTGGSCNPAPVESQGGGDTLYTPDYDLVYTVLGRRSAAKVSGPSSGYWIASRYYDYSYSSVFSWSGRWINSVSSLVDDNLYNYDRGFSTSSYSYALRPIVILKAGLSYSGSGTKSDPWVVG